MLYLFGITNFISPSALVGPGGWRQRCALPSLPRTATKPFLPTTSWLMLGGTSHHGFMITPVASALRLGVLVVTLPAIARCFQRVTPSWTSVTWKLGMLTMTYLRPRSRGSQRQRSMLRRMRLTRAVSVAGVVARAARNAPYCGWVGRSA